MSYAAEPDEIPVAASPSRAERVLVGLLRFNGAILLLACCAILLPMPTMQLIHDRLGLGQLPNLPIINYLTRSVSALYALHGAITLAVSLDVRRYRPLIGLLIVLNALFGIGLTAIDVAASMPVWWTGLEGPGILAFAVILGAVYRWAGHAKACDDSTPPPAETRPV